MNSLRTSLESLQSRLILLAALPPSLATLGLMLWSGCNGYLVSLVALLLLMSTGYCLLITRQALNYQVSTLINLVEAIIHGDFSLRGKRQKNSGAMNGLIDMINELAASMNHQRLTVKQQQYLVKSVINNIDVAIVALNARQEVAFINDTAVALLHTPAEEIQGTPLAELSFRSLFELAENSVVEFQFPERSGKFKIVQDSYFEQGQRQQLLFITDVSQLLREEEYRAWRNLLRVMSHEINNTLTPIASLSQVLSTLLCQENKENNDDIRDGLNIINERALNLKSFVESYRKLTSLPVPKKELHNINELISRMVALFEQRTIRIKAAPDPLPVRIDAIQIEQMLINILKNADESMPSPEGVITLNWQIKENKLYLEILDEGCGIGNPENIFVPLYSTKKNGSGIGLMLSRQIVESHGGYFSLDNRTDSQGCKVSITLPV